MRSLWLLLHLTGFVLWIGGGLSSMIIGVRGRSEDRYIQGAVARLQSMLHRVLIGPGAIITVLSGGFLTAQVMASGIPPSSWLMAMQLAGVLGALLVLFVSIPTSSRLARVEPVGESARLFDALRGRQA
ncbi:MAG: hypothetical protein ABJD11_18675, partial [Gemmatimonadota bacterium]